MPTGLSDGRLKISVEQLNDEITNDRQYKPWLPSPPKLVEYAGDIVNWTPMPECWEWSVDEVEKWLSETIGLPQYLDCIRRNSLNGRRLFSLLETNGLCKCGITDFNHIRIISDAIRRMFKVERPENGRSISLPPRYPWTHYLNYRVPTGPIRATTTPLELFRKMGLVDEPELCPFGHWQMIEPSYKTFPYNRFGLTRKKNVYRRTENCRQPRGHSYLKKSKTRANYFIRADIE